MLHVLFFYLYFITKGYYIFEGMGLHLGTLFMHANCIYNWVVEIEARKMFRRFSLVPPTCRQRTNCSAHEEHLAPGTRSQPKDANHHENCVSLVAIRGNAQRTRANGKISKMNLNFVLGQNHYIFFTIHSQGFEKNFWYGIHLLPLSKEVTPGTSTFVMEFIRLVIQ